jgi:phage major head subunit gpT-like protein
MTLTPAALAAIATNFQTLFQGALKATRTQWQMFAMLVNSSTKTELHAWLDEIDELREWIGPRQIANLAARAQELENKKYERTIAVKRDDVEDDRLGLYAPRLQLLGEAAALWPDKLVVDALNNGGAAVCYDGQYFFDTDHPLDPEDTSKGTQSNLHTTMALSSDNYRTVRARAMNIKGRSGVPMGIVPNLLIVPPALEGTALEIVKADMIAATAAAKTNVMRGTAEVMVVPRLASVPSTGDTTWYLACTTKAVKPIIFQQRAAPEMTSLTDPANDHVFQREEYLYGVRARGAGGYGLWQLIHKCTA